MGACERLKGLMFFSKYTSHPPKVHLLLGKNAFVISKPFAEMTYMECLNP